jgi:hypothetical protein
MLGMESLEVEGSGTEEVRNLVIRHLELVDAAEGWEPIIRSL